MRNPSSRTGQTGAFTIVEIMVAVVIIGLLAAVAIPSYRRINLKSRATAVANDIRVFSTAFETYNTQRGRWPADGDPGVIPPEMVDSLSQNFAKVTPIGGLYDWDNAVSANGFYTTAAITILTANGNAMTDDAELVEMVDKIMDDGNLNTGSVRLGSTNGLVFILAP